MFVVGTIRNLTQNLSYTGPTGVHTKAVSMTQFRSVLLPGGEMIPFLILIPVPVPNKQP